MMNSMAILFYLISFLASPGYSSLPPQQQLEQVESEKDKIPLLIQEAIKIFYSDQQKATDFINEAIELAEKHGDKENYLLALTKLAKFQAALGKPTEARATGLKALELANSMANPRSRLLALEALGMGAVVIGDYESSLDYYYQALEILNNENLNDPDLRLLVYGNVIKVLEELKQYDKAIEYALKGYEAIKDNPEEAVTSLYNISLLYIRSGDYENARKYADTLLETSQKLGRKWGESGAYTFYSEIDFKKWQESGDKKLLDSAEANARKSLDSLKGAQKDLHYADRLFALGDILNKKKQFKQAETFLLESLKIATGFNNNLNQSKCHNSLVETYKGMGNNSKAWEHNDIYQKLSAEISDNNLKRQLSSMMVRFDLAEKENELKEEKYKTEALEKDAEIKNYFLITLALATALALIVTAVIIWFYIQKKRTAKEFERLSKYDPLTQLMNRRAINEELENELNRFQRNNKAFTVIITDIDHFKNFNDTHGHDCGDAVLKEVAVTLKNNIRKMDKVARWGGEEFLFLLPETEEPQGALVAEKLRERIEDLIFTWKNQELQITMSFGLCQLREDLPLEECLKAADEALYRAKEAGRNKVALPK